MKPVRLTRAQFLTPIIIWWVVSAALAIYDFNRFQLQNILVFLFLAIVPGLLTMILSKIKGLPFWGYASLTVAFSLLELMLVGLLGNEFLPFVGIAQPLTKAPILIELYLLIGVLVAITWLRVRELEITIKQYFFFDNVKDFFVAAIPVVFVIMSVFGAISLNNGGNNLWTLIMLGGIGCYLIFLLSYINNIDENATLAGLFFISLSMLLMTDLRGWNITGHDIQQEYRVFELTKNAGLWNVATFRDAYNACLSITILPTIFFNMMNVADPYIYKFFFQIFFAFCPVLVYLIGRHWTNRRIAFLGTIYFIAFPTFFTDMPFLVRQEIAFLFFGLMMYLIFNENLDLKVRRTLFMLMGIGVILSHYSTTYTVLAILALVVVSRPLFVMILRKFKDTWFKNSALAAPPKAKLYQGANITFAMVAALFVLSFFWTQIITQTGSNVRSVIGQTFSAVTEGFGGDNRSVDVSTLLTFSKPNQNEELQGYIAQDVDPLRASAPTGTYYAAGTYDQYQYTTLPEETVPLTPLGSAIDSRGFNVQNFLYSFGELLAKLIEILVPLGMLYLLFRKKLIASVDDEIYLISFYCLVFLLACIVLPVLSVEYGIFRAMQQSMFIVAPIIVLGVLMTAEAVLTATKLDRYFTYESFAIIFAGIFFFYSTAFLPYLFGGNSAVLHLSNTGTYYDNYLIQQSEVVGVDWLNTIASASSTTSNGVRLEIQADRYDKFTTLTQLNVNDDIFPGVIQKNAYVFLDPTTVLKQRATIVFNSDPVTYLYPIQFLVDNKDLIYSNGGVEVYR